jgi:hypothetical protein
MNKPAISNPFFPDDSGLSYMPSCADIEQQLIDDAVLEEIQAGRLAGRLLTPDTQARILGSK